VASRTLETAPWGTSASATLLKANLAEAIKSLKQRPGGNIGVHGSPTLAYAPNSSAHHSILMVERDSEIG
jgi:hypothetical protein